MKACQEWIDDKRSEEESDDWQNKRSWGAWASVGHWPTNCYSLSTHQTHRAKTVKAGPENYFRRERMIRWDLQYVQQICDKTVEIQVWGNIRSRSLSPTPPAVVLGIFCLPAWHLSLYFAATVKKATQRRKLCKLVKHEIQNTSDIDNFFTTKELFPAKCRIAGLLW